MKFSRVLDFQTRIESIQYPTPGFIIYQPQPPSLPFSAITLNLVKDSYEHGMTNPEGPPLVLVNPNNTQNIVLEFTDVDVVVIHPLCPVP